MVPALLLCLILAGCSRHQQTAASATIRWDAPVEVARGGGTRGEWRQNNSDYDYVDDTTVALAPDGDAIVAWVDQRRKEVLVQRFAPDGTPRSAPLRVSRSPSVFSWLPRLATAGRDVHVLWQEIIFSGGSHGGETFIASSRDDGATFETPINLSRSRSGDGKGRITREVWHNGSLALAVTERGDVYAAWTEFDGPLWLSRSHDRGATFTRPQRIVEPQPARAPALAAAGDIVYLAWSVGEDAAADLRLAVSMDRGATVQVPGIVSRTIGHSDAPKLALDSMGTLHLAWSESTGGPFGRSHVRYMRSTDRGRTFEPSRALSTNHAGYPDLDIDGENVVVVWERIAGAHARSRGLSLVVSQDGGTTFGEPTLVAHSVDPGGGFNGSHQGRLMDKLAARCGRIVIANSALDHGRASRAWFVRGQLPSVSGGLRASASSRQGDR
jgi:hypothetical protein